MTGVLPLHLHLAARLCSAFHTYDYFAFFAIYKRLSDPAATATAGCCSGGYDPTAAFLLQQSVLHAHMLSAAFGFTARQRVVVSKLTVVSCLLLCYRLCPSRRHLLPLQINALRRLSLSFQPGAWFPLSAVRDLLALPSVADAAVLCKSLCGLAVRRPADWAARSLHEQEDSAVLAAEDARAAQPDGREHWAVQLGKAAAVPQMQEGDALVFKAFYSRELRRRLHRTGVQHESFAEDSGNLASQPHLFGLSETEAQQSQQSTRSAAVKLPAATCDSWEEHSVSDSDPVSAEALVPLWRFYPQTRWPADTLQRMLWRGS